MKGLLIKDILNLKKGFSTIIALFVFYSFLAFKSSNTSMLMAMIVLLMTMMSVTSMAYDDNAKWDNYARAMPIGRKTLVMSKYVLSIILTTVGTVVSTTAAYIIFRIKGMYNISELLTVAYAIFALSILFITITLPIIYKLGVERSRLIMMAVAGLPTAVVYLLFERGMTMPSEQQLMSTLKFSPFIILLSVVISFNISYKIYRNK